MRWLLTLALASVACVATAPEDDRFVPTPPDRATFPPVADLLVHRCGTLDCHGTAARNLRLYGAEGLRRSPTDRPTSHTDTTTVAEYDEDFLSVIALEPELLSDVVREHGANPDRLTLVRKARGTEGHKGLSPFTAGDIQDRCLTSWLAGQTDTAACRTAKLLF